MNKAQLFIVLVFYDLSTRPLTIDDFFIFLPSLVTSIFSFHLSTCIIERVRYLQRIFSNSVLHVLPTANGIYFSISLRIL